MALAVALIAIALTLAATPVAAGLARRFDLVDRPGPLKPQQAPVPYLGGAAVAPALAAGPVAAGRPELLAPMALALALGAVDDHRGLAPTTRLGAEVVVGIAAALVVPGPVAARAATAALVVILLNAWNLLDGLDGLAAGVALASGGAAATLGGDAAPVALAVTGATAGFLVFNRPPARIYLGDGGAYLLGTTLALTPALAGGGLERWSVWLATPMLFGIPVADVGVAVIRRARAGVPLFAGDRSHSYDQLVDRGLGVGAASALFAVAQAGLGALGVLAVRLDPPAAFAVTAAGTTSVFLACLGAGLFTPRRNAPGR